MLTFRRWRVVWRVPAGAGLSDGYPQLYSLVYDTPWDSPTLSAGRPDQSAGAGVYSYTAQAAAADEFDKVFKFDVVVEGAVDAYGAIVEHDDGTVRSQHARILALRVSPRGSGYCKHDLAVVLPHSRVCSPEDRQVIYCPCWYSRALYERGAPILMERFEDMLLERYKVPRLTDAAAPWPAPTS